MGKYIDLDVTSRMLRMPPLFKVALTASVVTMLVLGTASHINIHRADTLYMASHEAARPLPTDVSIGLGVEAEHYAERGLTLNVWAGALMLLTMFLALFMFPFLVIRNCHNFYKALLEGKHLEVARNDA